MLRSMLSANFGFVMTDRASNACLKWMLLLLCLTPGWLMAQARLDFSAIRQSAWLDKAAYGSVNDIRQVINAMGLRLDDVQLVEEINVAYFIASDERSKTQIVALRGTANAENALLDISAAMKLDPHSGLYLHEGFAYSAWQVFQRIRPKLRKGYRIETTGHSMGGAVALILAKYLEDAGFSIAQVITFGQPRVTNFNGAKAFNNLDVIRIVTPLDMVPLTPPFDPMQMASGNINVYWHVGTEVLLLQGDRYSILRGVQSMMRATQFARQSIAQQAINQHSMDYYLQLLQDKDNAAEQVPFESGFDLFRFFGQ